ncbi:MAG TPA: ABC transporter permease [Burkholderiaceae bacterium]|nr:ABC transporter permease [Burkholderiaceae bacterium]
MLTVIPLLACALIGWIFASGIPHRLPIVVIDQDHSAFSRQLLRWVDRAPSVRIAAEVPDHETAIQLLRLRQAYGLLVIPAGSAIALQQGRGVTIPWFYNAQFAAHSGALSSAVRGVLATFNAGVELQAAAKRGAIGAASPGRIEPLRPVIGTQYNEHTSYEPFLVLAVIPALIQILVVLAVVRGVGVEVRDGSIEHWLTAAGGSWSAALGAKLLVPSLCFTLGLLVYIGYYAGIRGWVVAGSPALLLAGAVAFELACLGLGLAVIGVTGSLRNAISATAILTAPAFAFSGQGFPLWAMPAGARGWAALLPLTHYLDFQSRVWFAGAPTAFAVADLAPLGAIAAVGALVGIGTLRWRAARGRWGSA